ncbi:hypothetical protein PG994_009505 [Apiospora phragmitis]|uniref:Aminoglycoside phosphotransferase domain-containing protein n=1 Tax=Apiospora phragmitis TaxID=2905665 RepID=A0ABR1U905_9PEZI
MDLTSIANQMVITAAGNGQQAAVADNSNKILAVKKVSDFGYIIRARFDGLIRYYSITHEAAANFPQNWETRESNAIIPPRSYAADLKCIHLRMPVISEVFDPMMPAQLRPTALHPVVVEPLETKLQGIPGVQHAVSADYETFVKLGKIPTPRFKHRRWDDRINIVRHPRIHNGQPMIMKIVEFPDLWNLPQAENAAPPGDAAAGPRKLNVGSDRSEFTQRMMGLEIQMHQRVTAAIDGLVPKFLGLVTERGRGVIGYVAEYIPDAKSFKQMFEEAYAAGNKEFRLNEQDRQACLAALKRLHDAGLHHGDFHGGNVLRRRDGSLVLIDFEETSSTDADGWVKDGFSSAEFETRKAETWLGWTSSEWRRMHTMSLLDVD